MPQHGFRHIETTLHRFTVKCSRCWRTWPETCLDKWDSADQNSRPEARYVAFLNRERARGLECQWGCSDASAFVALGRFFASFVTRKAVLGHGRIVNDEVQATQQVIEPGSLDALEVLNIQLEGLNEVNRIIASTYKS